MYKIRTELKKELSKKKKKELSRLWRDDKVWENIMDNLILIHLKFCKNCVNWRANMNYQKWTKN